MNQNIVASAVDLIDVDPTDEFLEDLRQRLIVRLMDRSGTSDSGASPPVDASPAESLDGYVGLEDNPAATKGSRRLMRVVVAAAATIGLLATAAVVVTRVDDAQNSNGELNDVNAAEALPLARNAFITADSLGQTYREKVLVPASVENQLAADTSAAMPECAILPSLGLVQPSTKSVAPSQFFGALLGGVAHTVFVFATPQDASKAMDAIEGDVYRACRFDLFDRMIPLEVLGRTSSSEPWDAPAIPTHGDRQVVFGQHTKFTGGTGDSEAFYVNVFVQVGRAISWMNPQMISSDKPRFLVDKAVDAQTTALESVFGH